MKSQLLIQLCALIVLAGYGVVNDEGREVMGKPGSKPRIPYCVIQV
jgi:hypothetical protein